MSFQTYLILQTYKNYQQCTKEIYNIILSFALCFQQNRLNKPIHVLIINRSLQHNL